MFTIMRGTLREKEEGEVRNLFAKECFHTASGLYQTFGTTLLQVSSGGLLFDSQFSWRRATVLRWRS